MVGESDTGRKPSYCLLAMARLRGRHDLRKPACDGKSAVAAVHGHFIATVGLGRERAFTR
jgi:hypothetical protein